MTTTVRNDSLSPGLVRVKPHDGFMPDGAADPLD